MRHESPSLIGQYTETTGTRTYRLYPLSPGYCDCLIYSFFSVAIEQTSSYDYLRMPPVLELHQITPTTGTRQQCPLG